MEKLALNHSMELTKQQKKHGAWLQIIWTFVLILIGQSIPELLKINTDTKTSNGFINVLLCQFFIIIVVILYCYLIERRNISSLGFSTKNILNKIGLGLLIGIGMMGGTFLLNLMTGSIHVTSNPNTKWGFIAMAFVGFLIQGFAEEIAFRGFLMNSIASKKGVLAAIIGNSVLFGVLHGLNPNISVMAVINLILAGLTYSLIFYLTDSIFVVGIMHGLWNYLQGLIFGVAVSGIRPPSTVLLTESIKSHSVLNGGDFGFEGGLISIIVHIIVLAVVIVLIKKKVAGK